MNMILNLYKTFNIENVINEINNYINIDSSIENNLINIIDDQIDNIRYNIFDDVLNDELYDEIDIEFIVELFDLKSLLKEYIINNIYYDPYKKQITNNINYKYYDDIIDLINLYDDDKIYENDVDEFEFNFNIEFDINKFNYYNSNDDLICYNSSIDMFKTINYYDIDDIFYIDIIIDEIFEFNNVY